MHPTIPMTRTPRRKPARRPTVNGRGAASSRPGTGRRFTHGSCPARRARKAPRRLLNAAAKLFGTADRRPAGDSALQEPLNAAAKLLLVLLVGICANCGSDDAPMNLGAASDAADQGDGRSETGHSSPSTADRGGGAASRDPPGGTLDSRNDWEPNATIERIVDGDTLIARIGGRSEPVRLIGIDTPESVARDRPVECYGAEASQRLQELLPPGTAVTLVRDVEGRDAYDRLLGYVVRSRDGLFVNLELVASGYAATLNIAPNDQYQDVLARAESEAIAARRGLWGACGGPDMPAE